MNIQLIHIQQLDTSISRAVQRPKTSKEFEYTSLAIEEDGKFYYWAKGVGFEINEHEYIYIKTNPKIYYFSTALKFHLRIQHAIQSNKSINKEKTSKGNYEDTSEYEVLERVRIILNSNIEKRLRISDRKIYHFAYGYFGPEYSGIISEDVYLMMKESVIFDVEDGWVVRRKTGEKLRKLQNQ